MHVVIMGCGRVGSTLARSLEKGGHSVAIIDRNPEAFRRLGADFGGQRVAGVGFDRDTLVEAGIERAAAFAAVSSGDNSNIISARVARETFGIEAVVARIYDPKRAEVYERFGIPTVATVRWAADQVLRRLLPQGSLTEWRDPSGSVVLAELHVHPSWIGRPIADLESAADVRVALLTRFGDGLLPTDGTLLQEGDLVHVAARAAALDAAAAVLGAAPEDRES